MKFSIRSFDSGPELKPMCELLIEDEKEVFPLPANFWTREQYESQWHEALRALVNSDVDRCILITDIEPPEISSIIFYRVIFREGEVVYMQERFVRDRDRWLGSAVTIAPRIAPRVQGTPEEHALVSQWEVSMDDIRQFLNR